MILIPRAQSLQRSKVRMINVVASNPFKLTPSQIFAFGRLDGITNGNRLPAAKLVGDAIDRGLKPQQAVEDVRAESPHLFVRGWTGYWTEDGDLFGSRR
jgi:hypothetical protein